jgi:hypothetical protein
MDDPGGDHRWLSYSQLGEARGISRASAIRLCRKHRWHRQVNNQGVVTVAVPVTFTVPDRRTPGDAAGDGPGDAHRALVSAVETLKGELARAHARGDAAETRAQRAADRVAELRTQLDVAERAHAEAAEALHDALQALANIRARQAKPALQRVWWALRGL